MRVRALLVTAAVAASATAPAAHAAKPKPKPKPKPSCNLVTDAKGDVSNKFQGVDAFPADNGLDLVGADVASDAKNITAVIRLANAPGSANVYAKRYIAQFRVAGQANPMILAAAVTPTGTTYSFGYYGNGTTGAGFNYSATPATGKIDGATITITAALADVAAEANLGAVKPGAEIKTFSITANRRVPSYTGAPGQVSVADDATGKGPYKAGQPSCVKVG
jgi:hypothetical protein